MTDPHLIQRPPASTDASAESSDLGLPLDLQRQTFNRMAIIGVVTAAMWVLTRIIYRRGFHLEEPYEEPDLRLVLTWTGVITSFGFAYVARFRHLTASRMLVLGQVYVVLQAFLIGGATHVSPSWEQLHPVTGSLTVGGVSWIAAWVITYSSLVMNRPRRTLATALIAVSMDPAWVYGAGYLSAHSPQMWQSIAGYGEHLVPERRFVVSIFAIDILMAFIATLPAKIQWHMSRQIRRARRMGSYQLTERLGVGGMGEVWKAEHRMLARPAAVKVVRPELLGARSPEEAQGMLRRFEREAQATAALHSPHSIELYDFGRTSQDTFYYVMELLDGLDLHSLVKHFGPLPAPRVIHLLRQACHSLYDAHRQDLIHRDVKPANIFTCRMGQDFDFVKVLDFGLVKARESSPSAAMLTADHVTSGTPAFMAPETVLGKKDVDHRADLYALGCVGYWLLTGQLVFEGESPMAVAVAHVQTRVVPPSRRGELEIPEDLERVILACLAKKPEDRPATARDLDQLLAACAGAGAWTNDKAERWWALHQPEVVAEVVRRETLRDLAPASSTLLLEKGMANDAL